jgi:hypothetical protein
VAVSDDAGSTRRHIWSARPFVQVVTSFTAWSVCSVDSLRESCNVNVVSNNSIRIPVCIVSVLWTLSMSVVVVPEVIVSEATRTVSWKRRN